jgi:gliding motility-associated-like protein
MRKLFVFVFVCIAALLANSQTQSICAGSQVTLVAGNPQNLSNPTYSMNPGGQSGGTVGVFAFNPTITANYTLYTTGTNSTNSVVTTTRIDTVFVNPQPVVAPTVTNATCTNSNNAFNLNLTFFPTSSTAAYTVAFPTAGAPNGWTGPTSTSVAGTIGPGPYSATITTDKGCSTIANFTILPQPPLPTFSMTPAGPVYSITCNTPSVTIKASNPANTYTFFGNGIGAPQDTIEITLTYTNANQGTYTLAATHPTSGCIDTKTFVLATNTVAPVATINPTNQTINCSISSITTVTLTAVSPTVNIDHLIIPPQGFNYSANNQVVVYQPGGTGTYTHILTNAVSGCSTVSTFTVVSTQGYPTFSVSSQQNFTIGCAPTKSFAVISFTNAAAPGGGAVSYTLLSNVTGTATVPFPAPLTGPSVYTITTPGTYTAVTRANANGCETRIPFPVTTNTFGPTIDSVSISRTVLDCNVKESILKGYGRTVAPDDQGQVSYNWTFPGTPGNFAGQQYTAAISPTAAVTATLNNNYTLTITDLNNTCISTTVITIKQNLYPPIPKIIGTGSITCATPTMMLSNFSSTGIPPGVYPSSQPVVGFLWEGPSPQVPKSNSSSYVAFEIGVYTLTAKDMNNGCTSQTTTVVLDNRVYPVFSPAATATLDCGAASAKIFPVITSATTGLAYTWTNAIVPTPTVSGANTATLSTNLPGKYYVIVTNTVNQCTSVDSIVVVKGSLTTSIEAGPTQGYAPLTVSLTNNSTSSTGNSSITTVWTFGNGTSSVTPSASIIPVTVYNQPGTYTVMAWVSKGVCIDSVSKVVMVEFPSALTIPNIFTPNNDGVNDLYFLKGASLAEVNMTIYDRWGHLVYQLTSDGNVAWDGKNQLGQDCAQGTYFFILTAKGKDGKDYNEKGNITLLR